MSREYARVAPSTDSCCTNTTCCSRVAKLQRSDTTRHGPNLHTNAKHVKYRFRNLLQTCNQMILAVAVLGVVRRVVYHAFDDPHKCFAELVDRCDHPSASACNIQCHMEFEEFEEAAGVHDRNTGVRFMAVCSACVHAIIWVSQRACIQEHLRCFEVERQRATSDRSGRRSRPSPHCRRLPPGLRGLAECRYRPRS